MNETQLQIKDDDQPSNQPMKRVTILGYSHLVPKTKVMVEREINGYTWLVEEWV